MNVSRSKLGAVGALTLLLSGCASENTLKTAGLLSVAKGKDAAALGGSSGTGVLPVAAEVDATLHQAQDLRTAGDFQGAAKLLSQLVLVLPDDARVLGEYAKALIGLGRSDDALAFVDRALELQPGDWSLYSARGVALDQKGDYRTAQLAYDRALALKPGDPTVLSNAALSHMQAGDLAGAEKLLLEALQAGGEYPRIASNLALVRSLRGTRVQPASAPPMTPSAPAATAAISAPPPAAASQPAAVASAPAVERPVPVKTPQLPAPAHPDKAPAQATAAQTVSAAPAPSSLKPPTTFQSAPTLVERLKSDPAVRMQAVPKDPKAGPVVPKSVAAKKDAIPAQATSSLQALSLRPALSEGKAAQQPPQPASAQRQAAIGSTE